MSGDYVVGSKIIYQNQILYYVYCANRPSSNASQLALGFKNKSGYFFIGEGFSDIYSEEPELFSRNIITLDDLKSPNIYNQPPIIYMGKNYNDLTNEQYENFKCWQEYVNKFEKSFSEQNLKLLRKRKQY